MRIKKTGDTPSVRSVGRAAYVRKAESTAGPEIPAAAAASIMGIPEAEFTPKVRNAIMALMEEVDSLRQELHETKKKLEYAEKAADQDQLLPLLNRRAFVRELMRSISVTGRYNTPSTLVYFDLNNFKSVNDTYGHAAGNAVLKHFSDILYANVRDSDVVGRLGGDEFGVILTHIGADLGQRKAERLAAVLENSPTLWQGKRISIGFSCGTFELTGEATADIAIAKADEAMYAHKRRKAAARDSLTR